MKMEDNVLSSVADDDKETALFLLNAIADEGWYPGITVSLLAESKSQLRMIEPTSFS